MGSAHGTITNKDNYFYWSVQDISTVLTGVDGANISSPYFHFEDESWKFVLQNMIPPVERPYLLLKLKNLSLFPKSKFSVRLCVEYRNTNCYRIIKNDPVKLNFRVYAAEFKFIPEDIIPNWSAISRNASTSQQDGMKIRGTFGGSRWLFSCHISKLGALPKFWEVHKHHPDMGRGWIERYHKQEELERDKKLQGNLNSLLHGGKHSDVVLKVGGQEFKAHRPILSARSDYFSVMFDNDTSENQTGLVTIEDCDPVVFQCLLQYIYTGETACSRDSIANLYTVADRYQVLELKEECANQIKNNLSISNFCDFVRMSLRHPEMNLTDIVSQYFTKNVSAIVSTSEWETFMQENPTLCNELFCKSLKSTS